MPKSDGPTSCTYVLNHLQIYSWTQRSTCCRHYFSFTFMATKAVVTCRVQNKQRRPLVLFAIVFGRVISISVFSCFFFFSMRAILLIEGGVVFVSFAWTMIILRFLSHLHHCRRRFRREFSFCERPWRRSRPARLLLAHTSCSCPCTLWQWSIRRSPLRQSRHVDVVVPSAPLSSHPPCFPGASSCQRG